MKAPTLKDYYNSIIKRAKNQKNFLSLLSGNVISQIIPFLIAPIITRIFTPIDFAVQANFIALIMLISSVAALRYEVAIVLPRNHRKARAIATLSFILIIVFSLFSNLLLFFKEFISRVYNDQVLPQYLWLVGIAVLVVASYNTFHNICLRFGLFKNLSYSKIAQSTLGQIIIAAWGYWQWGGNGLIYGWFLGQLLSMIYLYVIIKQKTDFKPIWNLKLIKKAAIEYKKFPLVNSVHTVADTFSQQFFLFWLITYFFGAETLGLFSIVIRYLRIPIQLIGNALSQVFYKDATQTYQDKKSLQQLFVKNLKTTLLFALPFLLIIGLGGRVIFTFYLGAQWTQAGIYAQYYVLSMFFYFLILPVNSLPLVVDKQELDFVFAIINYVLSLGTMIIMAVLGYSFTKILIAYTIVQSFVYICTGIWYYYLAYKTDKLNIANE
jgi:O-antigen/teichoic acid export membrane protein